MKAYHIMMFILIFNLMIWVVDTGLEIYDLDYSSIDPDVEEAETMEEKQNALLWSLAGTTIALVVAGLVAGAIIGGILRVEKASQAYVYGAFTAVFWGSYLQTASVFMNISNSVVGGIIVLLIFTAIVGYVFVVGLFQMVTGGWKSYE